MNSFEKHLKENKEQLDLEQVDPNIWLSIENEVLRKKHRRTHFYLKLVAAFALLIIVSSVVFFQFQTSPKTDIHAQLIELYNLQNHDFPKIIHAKKASLANATIPIDRVEDFKILTKQLQLLENQYMGYVQYIEQYGYQDFIGEQIFFYYKSKIELLDKIHLELQKIDRYENYYDEQSPKVELNL